MTALSYAMTDSTTMLGRQLRHMLRYPATTAIILGVPVVFLLIFVYVFGGTLGAGLGHLTGGRAAYVRFVTPGILLMTVAAAAQATAISVAMDMTSGIMARFRTMAIARSSVLTGHVAGSVIQAMAGLVIIVGVALLAGFRTGASPGAWLAVAGLLALTALALTWLSVALGLCAKTVETASNTPMFLMLLPFLGGGFVPTSSLPVGLRWFAEYQPFTPVTEAVRGLLVGGPVAQNALLAVAWFAGLTVVCFLWARRLYRRPLPPAR